MISSCKKSFSLLINSLKLQNQQIFQFSDKTWKERDDAAQKVYISRTQKDAMKKLLDKMSRQQSDSTQSSQKFESELNQILKRHNVKNQAFRVEVLHLHKQL